MRARLQLIADLVLAVSAAAVAAVVILRNGGLSRPEPSVPYRVGDSAPTVPGINFGESDQTLLLVLRSSCHFCTESMPLYRRLAEMRRERLRLVAVGSKDDEGFSEYVHANYLNVDKIVTVAAGALKPHGTPTLILADRSHKVTGVWVGRLSEEKEKDLLRAVAPIGRLSELRASRVGRR